ncbi:hypothetical protein GGR47_003034 [Sphingomonas aquatilis]|uniref:Uncharacterized protein n=1 Tax=Sphingomonas aquatilis TaxID=93063 RepID=A0AAW3TV27_9SPHN|nr:hypothetical protein [Sphingomonas aquatilis]
MPCMLDQYDVIAKGAGSHLAPEQAVFFLRHPGLTLRRGGRFEPLAIPLRLGGPRTKSGVTEVSLA